MEQKEVHSSSPWIQWTMVGSCAVFIFVLALSAVYDPSIRVLHALQAGIYIGVIILTRRNSAWGYGAGCLISIFWNWTNLIHTTFIANGFRELLSVFQTAQVRRPDQLIAILAATAHFVLIAACIVGYSRIRPKASRNLLKFVGGGVLAIGYFAIIIILFGRQYVPLLRRVFGV